MKKIVACMGFSVLIVFGSAVFAEPAELRHTESLNRQWKFTLGDSSGAEAVAFDDTGWSPANLPHSFSLPYFAADRFYVGYGWYRKHFTVPQTWSGKRVNLEFDGVFQVAEVFINGRRIGEHKGGYTGFTFDITDAVKAGDNVAAIRVNNNWDPRLAPRAGEHTFSGGIYRNVRLVVTAPVHVAWYGTFVTTPRVSKDSAVVHVKTEVVNQSGVSKTVTIRHRIEDADGHLAVQMESVQTVAAGATLTDDQTSGVIANPRLWSPKQPSLYAVKTTIADGQSPVDTFTTPFGIRWFKFTADQGFFLNGEHWYFKGANVHQDHAGWGDAVADSGAYRDVRMIKEAGMDFIRGSHYPHSPAFARACDELGMLFMSENCFWGTTGFRSPWAASAYPTKPEEEPDFQASVRNSLRDMIRIHRNHPSIVVWSMDNEVFFCDRSVLSKVQTFLRELTAYSHQLDPTRPAAIGGCQRGDLDKLGDIAGYNGDGARLFADPGIPSIVTEYGSTMTDRPGSYDPGWGDLPSTPGADRNTAGSWRLPWRSGEVIWCGFDHGSLAGRRFGAMGFVDYFRLPKRQWYWYRNEYLQIAPPAWPVQGSPAALTLTADTTTLRRVDGTEDAQLIVTVVDKDGKALSNCPPVTLTIVSGPGEFPTGSDITFAPDSDIAIRDGQAAIEFRSYDAGKTTIRASSPGLKEAVIEILSQGQPAFVPGSTPAVAARPYVRFSETTSRAGMTFGRANPTRVSSETQDHSGRFANDGNPQTFWQSGTGDANPWLCIDLERIVTVGSVTLTFLSEDSRRFRVEVSEDGNGNWKLISDQTQNAGRDKIRVLPSVGSVTGRFLRVVFTDVSDTKPADLVDMEATGTVSGQ